MSSKDFLQFMSEKNKQIQTLQKKQQSVDFNAYNYDIEELAAILKFEKFPLNPGKIKRRILELKRNIPFSHALNLSQKTSNNNKL